MRMNKMILLAILLVVLGGCGSDSPKSQRTDIIEDTLVSYPGRTFSYKDKFRDTQAKQEQAAKAIGLSTPPQNRQQAAKMRRIILWTRSHILSLISYPLLRQNWRV